MIIKCSFGTGMSEGVSYYSTDKETKQATGLRTLIGRSPFIESTEPQDIEDECLGIYSEGNKSGRKLEKYVFRAMFSVQAKEKLNDSTWRTLVQDYCKEYGFDLHAHQFLLYKHDDTNNQHVHLIVNRKPFLGGKLINDSYDRVKSQAIIPKLIAQYGLEKNPKVVKATSNVWFDAERERKLIFIKETCNFYLSQLKLWNHSVLKGRAVGVHSFSDILKQNHGIELDLKRSDNNKIVGVTFIYEGERFSGQQAGLKADRLIKKVQQVKDKTYRESKAVNDALRAVMVKFNNRTDWQNTALLKKELTDAGFFLKAFSDDKTVVGEPVRFDEVLSSFKFNYQDFSREDIDGDLLHELGVCMNFANNNDNKVVPQHIVEPTQVSKLGDSFAIGSDAQNNSKFRAMNEDDEQEQQKNKKKGMNMR